MIDKNRPKIKFVSPVVSAINRGEKRKVLSIVVKPDAQIEYEEFGAEERSIPTEGAEVKQTLVCGRFIKQRPYDIVAAPFLRVISSFGFLLRSVGSKLPFIVKGQEADFQTGLNALAELTNGKVYVGVRSGSVVSGMKGVEVEGPHPAANVGVQINHIKPVNKGEVVWTVNPADVIVIGRLFNKGVADFQPYGCY